MIHISSFVRRQTPASPFSHWEISDEELLNRIEKGWKDQKKGYREGVILIPISCEDIFSGVIKLKAGDRLVGEYSARKEGEEPRMHIYGVGKKMPAVSCYVVLYSHDVLKETGQNETNCAWEMVSLNASPDEVEAPIQPWTLIANHFGWSGGSNTKMTDEEFVKALKDSTDYWKDKALVSPF